MKYKTIYLRSMTEISGKQRAYYWWRRRIILKALTTLYLTNDNKQLWGAIEILNNEIRKAKRENFTRITGGEGWK